MVLKLNISCDISFTRFIFFFFQAGQAANYVATLPVLKAYPKIKLDVKWELKTDGGDVACILISTKLNWLFWYFPFIFFYWWFSGFNARLFFL